MLNLAFILLHFVFPLDFLELVEDLLVELLLVVEDREHGVALVVADHRLEVNVVYLALVLEHLLDALELDEVHLAVLLEHGQAHRGLLHLVLVVQVVLVKDTVASPKAGLLIPRGHYVVEEMAILLILALVSLSVQTHLDTRVHIVVRVHELIGRVHEHDFFWVMLAQVEHNDLVVDGHLQDIAPHVRLKQVHIFVAFGQTLAADLRDDLVAEPNFIPYDRQLGRVGHIAEARVLAVKVVLHHHSEINQACCARVPQNGAGRYEFDVFHLVEKFSRLQILGEPFEERGRFLLILRSSRGNRSNEPCLMNIQVSLGSQSD